MHKIILLTLTALLTTAFLNNAIAGSKKALSSGFIHNKGGEKCSYQQVFENQVIYFTQKHMQDIGIIKFDDPDCMKDTGIGLDINKMMINNIISRWYSHSDADFKNKSRSVISKK